MVGVEFFLSVEEGLMGWVFRCCVSVSKEEAGWKGGKRATGGGPWGPQNRRVNRDRLVLARLQYWILRCECEAQDHACSSASALMP